VKVKTSEGGYYMGQANLNAQVPRPALMDLLDNLSEKRFIYIHAPAGYGKTVSAQLWMEHRGAGLKRAMISLDEYDNKTSEFCKRFITALVSIQPKNTALRELATHPGLNAAPIEFVLHALGEFVETTNEYVLVIDDLHVISSGEILKALPILCRRLPQNCIILFLSRTMPPDSFSEMATKEELAVVDATHLQFTGKEIKTFFERYERRITNKEAEEILLLTGGWAIGIQALLLSGEKSFSQELSDRYLENYLKVHIWEKWDDRLRYFMTLISVVEELTPELCERLTAGEKSQEDMAAKETLASLARENAFLRETGKETYRFHDLFREFLIVRLTELGKQVINKQWSRAGDHFYDKKDYFRAAECYSKGNNDDGAADSLYNMYDYFSSYTSIEDTLYIIRLSVNPLIVEKHPFLLEVQAWAAYVEGRSDDFEKYLDLYYKLLPKIVVKRPRAALLVILLRAIDYRESFVYLAKSLRIIPFKGSIKAPTPSVTQNMPFFHRSFRDLSELAAEDENITKLINKFLGVLFKVEYSVMKECISAGISYEKGKLPDACEHALAACANIQEGCSAEIKFNAMMILTSALFTSGKKTEADRVLDNVTDMIESDKAFYLISNLQAYRCRLRLTDGDKNAAGKWLRDNGGSIYDNLTFFGIYKNITTARAHIVLGNYSDATLFLQKVLRLSKRYERPLDIIEAHILLAIAHWKKGQEGRGQSVALDTLTRAVEIAHNYEYIQLFANDGAELTTMLHRLQKRAVQSSYSGTIPAEFLKTLYVAAVAGSKISKGLTGGKMPAGVTFTEKQKAVMRLMCAGHSRNEIAKRMGLKPNGVISHTTLIYKKLDVSNNIDAVLKIKELGLSD